MKVKYYILPINCISQLKWNIKKVFIEIYIYILLLTVLN